MEDRAVDFVCIGAPRCGTTWLSENLSEHRDIYIPGQKAMNYFNVNWNKGIRWYSDAFRKGKNRVKGEISPLYFGSEIVLKRMHEQFPRIKIVVIVREPIQRLKSQVNLINNLRGEYKDLNFRINENPEILEMGLYHRNIKMVLKFFNPQQLLILNYNDIKDSPLSVLEKVHSFLGVTHVIPSKAESKVGYTLRPKYRSVEKLRIVAYEVLVKLRLGSVIRYLKTRGFTEALKKFNHSNKSVEHQVNDGDVDSFLKEYYSEDTFKLHRDFDISFR